MGGLVGHQFLTCMKFVSLFGEVPFAFPCGPVEDDECSDGFCFLSALNIQPKRPMRFRKRSGDRLFMVLIEVRDLRVSLLILCNTIWTG